MIRDLFRAILAPFNKPKPKPKDNRMISEVAIEVFRLQQYSLNCAQRMRACWADATEEQRKQLLDTYIESRRALPRLANGKHLGHSEAYRAASATVSPKWKL